MKNRKETSFSREIHPDLLAAQKLAYEPAGFTSNSFVKEAESEEYGAFTFEMNGMRIKFRVAKITPTKIGQFVTLWKRIEDGPILPYDKEDPFDLFIVSVRSDSLLGQFIFPKTVLCEKGVISKEGKGGKRAIRVYPPWDHTESPQAKKTQGWQIAYFLDIPSNGYIDSERMHALCRDR